MKLALLQLGTAGVEGAAANLEAALAAIDAAGAGGAQLAILPEATYPAYLLGRNWRERGDLVSFARLVELLGERARRWGMGICAGLADRERGTNSAVLVAPDGSPAGRHDKVFLWHFDSRWFVRGRSFAAWDLPWGKTGMLICADARYPEGARLLALRGAALILDPAGLVAVGKDFSNSQLDYLLPVRAAENGLHLALAGKVGHEGGFIRYAGGSAVFAPDGTRPAGAVTDAAQTLAVEVDLTAGKLPFPVSRRPELYGDLCRRLAPAFAPPVPRACLAAALCLPRATAPAQTLADLAPGLAAAQTRLLLFPPVPKEPDLFGLYAADRNLPALLEATRKAPWTLVVPLLEEGSGNGVLHHTGYVLEGGRILGKKRATHLPPGSRFRPGNRLEPVETPWGRLGIMLGPEGLVPEVARILALHGAETLCWAAGSIPAGVGLPALAFARARADENRVNLLLAARAPEGAAVVAAGGGVLGLARPEEVAAALGRLDRWAARDKELVPGTDLFADRHPEDYGLLAEVGAG